MKRILASIMFGAVALALSVSGSLPAQAADAIRFGMAPEPYPPFATKNASGQWEGFEIDLMNAVCEQMQAQCEIVETAWDGIIPALQEKKLDVIWNSMSITDERKQVIDFTDKYYNTPAVFIGPKGTDIQITPEGLKGKIIGVQTATTHANYAQKYFPDSEIKLYDTQDNANADLVAGRVDVVLADAIALDAFLKSDQGKDFEVKMQAPEDPLFGYGVGGGVRKEDTALRDKLNAAIKALRDNGKYDEIAKKYFDFDIYGS
jgi:polar amino acid transport system substrate-binding protein